MTETTLKNMAPELAKQIAAGQWEEIERLTKEFDMDPFKMDVILHVIDNDTQKYLLGRFSRLYRKLKEAGATEEELTRMAKYLKVLVHARKLFLNEPKAHVFFRIANLVNKYEEATHE